MIESMEEAMTPARALRRRLEIALAFARAAAQDPKHHRMARAMRYAANVYPRIQRLDSDALSMNEAREVLILLAQLRDVVARVAHAEAAWAVV
jgi:hypothetical protein